MTSELKPRASAYSAGVETRRQGDHFVMRRSEFVPAYLRTYELGQFEEKIRIGQHDQARAHAHAAGLWRLDSR